MYWPKAQPQAVQALLTGCRVSHRAHTTSFTSARTISCLLSSSCRQLLSNAHVCRGRAAPQLQQARLLLLVLDGVVAVPAPEHLQPHHISSRSSSCNRAAHLATAGRDQLAASPVVRAAMPAHAGFWASWASLVRRTWLSWLLLWLLLRAAVASRGSPQPCKHGLDTSPAALPLGARPLQPCWCSLGSCVRRIEALQKLKNSPDLGCSFTGKLLSQSQISNVH